MPQIDQKCNMVSISTIWVLSDGKAGDEIQCLGVAEQILDAPLASLDAECGKSIEIRRIKPRAPWRWFSQLGIRDPAESRIGEAFAGTNSPLSGPLPDLVIASGRRTVPYIQSLTRLKGRRPFTVYLKDPRTSPTIADFIWAPCHDSVVGPNVLKTITSPHRVSIRALEDAKIHLRPELAGLAAPHAAVLIGGNSRHHTFQPEDIARLTAHLENLAVSGASLMISASRRTPEALSIALQDLARRPNVYVWNGKDTNPYLEMLVHADAIVVTADSVNMVGEAAALGVPVHVFHPSGGHRKISAFLESLSETGTITDFDGHIETGARLAQDSTPEIATAIQSRFNTWKIHSKP